MAKAKPTKTEDQPVATEQQSTTVVPPGTTAPIGRRPSVVQRPKPEAAKPEPVKEQGVDPFDFGNAEDTEVEEKPKDQPATATPPSAEQSTDAPSPDETPAPTVYKHSKRLTRDALLCGFTQSQIDGMDSDTLDDMVEHRQGQVRRAYENQARIDAERKEQAAKKSEEPEIELPPEAAAYGEEDKKVLRGIVGKSQKAIAALEAKIEALEKISAETQQRENRRSFQALCAKNEALLGTGETATARANAVGGWLQTLPEHERTSFEADFERGLKLLFGALSPSPTVAAPATKPVPPAKSAADDPLAKRKEEWVEGAVARPTERSEPELPPGDARALRYLKEKLGGRAQPVNVESKDKFFQDFFG